MAHDYKNATENKKSGKSVPGWLIFFTGLSVGLFAAFLYYLQQHSAELKQVVKKQVEMVTHEKPAVKENKKDIEEKTKTSATKPKFDFYTILPGLEVIIPEQEIKDQKGKKLPSADKSSAYILQAGSFKSFKEADRLKAELALLGIVSTIQTVTINNNDTWHRVRIGPIKDADELKSIRRKLKQNDVNAILLKIKT